MQFIKRNYEKILLGLVLAGLVVVAVFLLFLVASQKEGLEELRKTITSVPVKPLPPPDLGYAEAIIKLTATPKVLNYSDSTHKLFNPERWQKTPNAPPYKNPVGTELQKLEITKIGNLYFTVSLESINPADSGTRYGVGIDDQSAARANQRGKRTSYVSKGEKKEYGANKETFTLVDVLGPADNPTALVIELSDDAGKTIQVSKEKPFRRVDGYTADLRYPPENNKAFLNRRANDPSFGKILVAGEDYSIVNITENEVILKGNNQKKWTIKYNAGPPN
jgi:hypothetical protein